MLGTLRLPIVVGCALGVAGFVVLAPGCGGGDGEDVSAPAPTARCSDAAFRLQDEELYVAQATAQNAARSGIGPDDLTIQLRQGIRALRARIQEHPPCSAELQEVAQLEARALDGLEDAALDLEALEPGEGVPPAVRDAIERELARLQDAGERLRQ